MTNWLKNGGHFEFSKCKSIRLVTYKIPKRRGKNGESHYYLFTNLNRGEFTDKSIQNMYKLRWKVEEGFKTIKSEANGRHFKTKSLENMNKELWIRVIAILLTRLSIKINEKSIVLKNINKILSTTDNDENNILDKFFVPFRTSFALLLNCFLFPKDLLLRWFGVCRLVAGSRELLARGAGNGPLLMGKAYGFPE